MLKFHNLAFILDTIGGVSYAGNHSAEGNGHRYRPPAVPVIYGTYKRQLLSKDILIGAAHLFH